jgi:hypothetical protein
MQRSSQAHTIPGLGKREGYTLAPEADAYRLSSALYGARASAEQPS